MKLTKLVIGTSLICGFSSAHAFADTEYRGDFRSVAGSSISGEVEIEIEDSEAELEIELENLKAGEKYIPYLHTGSRCSTDASTFTKLGRLAADRDGEGKLKRKNLASEIFINAKSVSIVSVTERGTVACAELENDDD